MIDVSTEGGKGKGKGKVKGVMQPSTAVTCDNAESRGEGEEAR